MCVYIYIYIYMISYKCICILLPLDVNSFGAHSPPPLYPSDNRRKPFWACLRKHKQKKTPYKSIKEKTHD